MTPDTRTALITGASAGIGRAFAEELAADGFDLVLTARRLSRLEALGQELEKRYGVHVMSIGADLADPATPRILMQRVEAAGKPVDMLVNNAGYGIAATYLDAGWDQHAAFIRVLVTAVCELTHLALPSMIERGYGRIVNVASVAALLPGSSGATLYGGAKAFLVKFTESLWLELEGTGVHVSALCPGFTYSEFHDVSGTRQQVSKLPGFLWMDANTVARQGIEAVHRGQPVCVNGAANKALVGTTKVVPGRLALALSRRQSKRFGLGLRGQ